MRSSGQSGCPTLPGRILPWVTLQIALSGVLSWWNWGVLNHDAIAYCRLAEYHAAGDVDRMVSGYWGPLFGWLIAAGLKAGLSVELAARSVMCVSATTFLLGSQTLPKGLGWGGPARVVSLAMLAICGAIWSAQNITPDLLMAGLAVWAIGLGYPTHEGSRSRDFVAAGVLWGLAYLAKPIALPWMLGVVGLQIALAWFRGQKVIWKQTLTVGVALLVAAPWVGIISAKYGRLSISTSGLIAHAIAGPTDVERYHPTFVTLHRPEPGRITSWEDPTGLDYRPWSPFDSTSNFMHQIRLIATNVFRVLFITTTLVPVWPWLLWRMGCRRWPRDATLAGLLPVVVLGGLYLPFHLAANEQRYFFAAVPLLWAAMLNGEVDGGSRDPAAKRDLRRAVVGAALVLVFVMAAMVRFSLPPRTASREAQALAGWLDRQDLSGPVAGSGLQRGGRTGLFLAWHLREPWYGDDPSATAEDLVSCGARLIVVDSSDPRIERLSSLPGVLRLNPPQGTAPHVLVFSIDPQAGARSSVEASPP